MTPSVQEEKEGRAKNVVWLNGFQKKTNFCHVPHVEKKNYILYFLHMENKNLINARHVEIHTI